MIDYYFKLSNFQFYCDDLHPTDSKIINMWMSCYQFTAAAYELQVKSSNLIDE
jgi:hypothetical protein